MLCLKVRQKQQEIQFYFRKLRYQFSIFNFQLKMSPIFFANQLEFRAWLEQHHTTATELIVGYYKVNSGNPSMTWSESVDQALCFGWIDGVRRSFEADSYTIRFTPRRATSIWSTVNIKKVAELTEKGLMQPAGIEAFKKRKEEKSEIYAYEKAHAVLSEDFENQFKANPKAWAFFTSQAPSYQKVMLHWITSAKQEKTRIARLEKTILESEKGNRVM